MGALVASCTKDISTYENPSTTMDDGGNCLFVVTSMHLRGSADLIEGYGLGIHGLGHVLNISRLTAWCKFVTTATAPNL